MINLFIKEAQGSYESIHIDSSIVIDVKSAQQLYFTKNYESFTMTFADDKSIKITFIIKEDELSVTLNNIPHLIKENENLQVNRTAIIFLQNEETLIYFKNSILKEDITTKTALELLNEKIQAPTEKIIKLLIIDDFSSLVHILNPSEATLQDKYLHEVKHTLFPEITQNEEKDRSVKEHKEDTFFTSNINIKTNSQSKFIKTLPTKDINKSTDDEDISEESIVIEDIVSTKEDTAISIDVLENDIGTDTNVTLIFVSNATNGTTQIVDGKVLYTPNASYYGSDSFTYTNSQGNTQRVSITVIEVIDTVEEELNYGSGDDNIYIQGEISAQIDLGNGDNTLTVEKTPMKIYAGSGDDTIVINANQTHKVYLGGGDNTITVDGFSKAISAGSGDDVITVMDSSKGSILMGEGDNSITISLNAASIKGGSGIDTINIGLNSNGNISTYAGDDIVNINGKSNRTINLGSGDDTLNIGSNAKTIIAGSGDDTIYIGAKALENIYLGDGNDSITIGGSISATIDAGEGVDTITLNNYTYLQYDNIKEYLLNFNTIVFTDKTISLNENGSYSTPLIFDLDGDGIETLSIHDEIKFDIDADGDIDITGWVGSDDGLLVHDINKDGIINDASELFGEESIKKDATRASDGYDALRDLDSNEDGVINLKDEAFSQLQIWRDSNSNALTDEGELLSLEEANISEIFLETTKTNEISNGNLISLTSIYLDNDGNEQEAADVWFEIEVNNFLLNNEKNNSSSLEDNESKEITYTVNQSTVYLDSSIKVLINNDINLDL